MENTIISIFIIFSFLLIFLFTLIGIVLKNFLVGDPPIGAIHVNPTRYKDRKAIIYGIFAEVIFVIIFITIILNTEIIINFINIFISLIIALPIVYLIYKQKVHN